MSTTTSPRTPLPPLPPLPPLTWMVLAAMILLALVPAVSAAQAASVWLTQAIGTAVTAHHWWWAGLLSAAAGVVNFPQPVLYVAGLALAGGVLVLMRRSAWGRRADAAAVIFVTTLLVATGSVACWAVVQLLLQHAR